MTAPTVEDYRKSSARSKLLRRIDLGIPERFAVTTTITVANRQVYGPPLSLSPGAIIDYNVRQDFSGAENSRTGAPNVYANLQSADKFPQERGGDGYNTRGNPPSLTGVKPGRYWVQVNPPSSDTYVASVTSGGKDLFREPLVVPFGASVPPIAITVRNDPGEIEVTIEGKNNGPAAGVTGSIIRSCGIDGFIDTRRTLVGLLHFSLG